MSIKEFLESAELINPDDKDYTDGHIFMLAFGSYGEHRFAVYAKHLQEALELTGEYFKTKGYTGLMQEFDPEDEYFDESYVPVNGGEFYIPIPGYVEESND